MVLLARLLKVVPHGRSSTGAGRAGGPGPGGHGRDHKPFGFSIWRAGRGIEGGMTYGRTDDFDFKAIENPVHIHDIIA